MASAYIKRYRAIAAWQADGRHIEEAEGLPLRGISICFDICTASCLPMSTPYHEAMSENAVQPGVRMRIGQMVVAHPGG